MNSLLRFNLPSTIKRFAAVYGSPVHYSSPMPPYNFRILYDHPRIVYVTIVRHLANLFCMSRYAREVPMTYVVGFSWSIANRTKVARLAREHRMHEKRFPRHSIHYICNSPEEMSTLSKYGLPCDFVNKNAFLDESLYHVIPGSQKHFDAVMNARMAPFKRHGLARKIERLALITSPDAVTGSREYVDSIRRVLADAHWLNDGNDGAYRRLNVFEVCDALNAAKVGLILSKNEGQCQASAEYLLCGLPVVSTRSKGGREAFFNDTDTIIVDENPEAVEEGVRTMISRNLDPQAVRDRMLRAVRAASRAFLSAS